MESKVLASLRRYEMVSPGDHVICAVSGGADSVALLWCMWLLKEKLGISVSAAHFNHHLRGAESDSDEAFVRELCAFHDIPLQVGGAHVVPGKKGLEAAARDARYTFLRSLDGTIATAHTADDNAETVLMHLVRGSGLRGLGGITPKSDRLIRPMLDVTRAEVEAFLQEHWIRHITDSSNESDEFLRNRLRHHVMPLLKAENPSIALGLSAAAQRLRQDAELLDSLAAQIDPTDVAALRAAPPPLRRRALEALLRRNGFPEPSASHIAQAEGLVFSEKPSARARFGPIQLVRRYDRLTVEQEGFVIPIMPLPREGSVEIPELELRIVTGPAEGQPDTAEAFTVCPVGQMVVRSRISGDSLTTRGGTKTLKKRFIDKKIPQFDRAAVPVVADDVGVLGVRGFGPDEKRKTGESPVRIQFVLISEKADK